jgi:hypothetical protein
MRKIQILEILQMARLHVGDWLSELLLFCVAIALILVGLASGLATLERNALGSAGILMLGVGLARVYRRLLVNRR